MEIITYEIQKGDTLETIAEKHDITVKELVDFHNQHCGITQQIIWNEIPMFLQKILINSNRQKQIKLESTKIEDNSGFNQQAMYRCEQSNVSKINGNFVSNTIQKQQFSVFLNKNDMQAKVLMDDFYYDLNPAILNRSFEMIEHTEKIRNNVIFKYDEDGKILKILNKKNQNEEWKNFKETVFQELEFTQILKMANEKAYNDLIEAGDKQFSINHPSEFEYQSSYFYMCLFDKHLTSEDFTQIKPDKLRFRSAIFPNIEIDIEAPYHLLKIENNLAQIRKVGSMKLTEKQKESIIECYNKNFKPLIHYKFSNYKIDIRINRTIDIDTRFVIDGKITIIESVEDNIENLCEVTVKKI